jgi:hypothetical protein
MLGISLYSYLYLKLAKKIPKLSDYFLCFLFNKIGKKGRTGSALEVKGVGDRGRRQGGRGESWPKQCMHI